MQFVFILSPPSKMCPRVGSPNYSAVHVQPKWASNRITYHTSHKIVLVALMHVLASYFMSSLHTLTYKLVLLKMLYVFIDIQTMPSTYSLDPVCYDVKDWFTLELPTSTSCRSHAHSTRPVMLICSGQLFQN